MHIENPVKIDCTVQNVQRSKTKYRTRSAITFQLGCISSTKNPAYDRVQFVNVIPSISILPTMELKLNINRKYRNGLFSKVRMGNGGLTIPLPG